MSNVLTSLPITAEAVLNELEEKFRNQEEKVLSDEDLLSLHSIFGVLIQRALEVLENNDTLLVHTTLNKHRKLIEIKGENDRRYLLFPSQNYCPCYAFKYQVLQKRNQVCCKHVLAARLAVILNKTEERIVEKEQYLDLVKSLFTIRMDEGTSQYYFTAAMETVKTLCSLLKAIQFQESAIFCALPEGLKLTVEEGKCVQASAYVPSDNFTQYHVREDVDVMFRISIAVLSECLNIFGSGEESSLKMYYRGEGSPLLLVLQPQTVHNVMTDCEIATQTADSVLDLRDEDSPEVAKLVLKAPAFLGLLADIERSCDVIELNLSPEHPNVSIVSYGMQDRSCIDVPKSSDMVQSFSCNEPMTLKYQLHHIRLIMKALAISTKVVLRCSSNGLLLLQLKLEKEDQRQMFSEFYIVPLLDV